MLNNKKIKKRILIKLSGESLGKNTSEYWSQEILHNTAKNILPLIENNYSVILVIGGGNIYRGIKNDKILSKVSSDYIGMLATVMNGIMLKNTFKYHNINCHHLTSLDIPKICTPYSYSKALKYLDKGKLVIISGGTGNPFCTTDTASIQKAIETNCDEILKATNTDGVYSEDPKNNPNAKRFDKITYDEIIKNGLKVMDMVSIIMAKDHKIPIKVFNSKESFLSIIENTGKFTIISK